MAIDNSEDFIALTPYELNLVETSQDVKLQMQADRESNTNIIMAGIPWGSILVTLGIDGEITTASTAAANAELIAYFDQFGADNIRMVSEAAGQLGGIIAEAING